MWGRGLSRSIAIRKFTIDFKMLLRRICNMKLKVIKRKILRILVLMLTALFYNEFLVYYLVLWSCHYPNPNSNNDTKIMVLADTHLLGSRLGHWADKLRREWQMYRTFQTAQTLFRPKHVFFLGKYIWFEFNVSFYCEIL